DDLVTGVQTCALPILNRPADLRSLTALPLSVTLTVAIVTPAGRLMCIGKRLRLTHVLVAGSPKAPATLDGGAVASAISCFVGGEIGRASGRESGWMGG